MEKIRTLDIIISKTKTKIGEMIRTVIGGQYNHCSFCLNGDVSRIYGFSRKHRQLWFTGCFTQENAFYYDEYVVYRIPITEEQYIQLSERIAQMRVNVKMYNYAGALMVPLKIPVDGDGSFICSTFIAELIDKYTDIDLEKDINLYRPMDIYELLSKNARRVNLVLPQEEEEPLEFLDLMDEWNFSVKNVARRNLRDIENRLRRHLR